MIAKFFQDESGATAIEYGLIAALVAGVIITGLGALGTSLNTKFSSVAKSVDDATPGGTCRISSAALRGEM